MSYHEWVQRDGFVVTSDLKQVNIEALHKYLSTESYWAKNIPREIVEKGVKNSLNFSLLSPQKRFIGYAKLITDRATFAYLADVYIEKEFRGQGLGKWLMECIMSHPELQNLRLWLLHTKDAHSLYSKFGFSQPTNIEKIMHIYRPASECYDKK